MLSSTELKQEEKELVQKYRELSHECRDCIMLLIASAKEYSTGSGRVINILDFMVSKV